MPTRAPLSARLGVLAETRRRVMHCIVDHGAVLARLTPDYLRTLSELELEEAEAEFERIALEDELCRGTVELYDAWRRDGFPG